jgi:threonine dehydratase
VVAFSSGNHAQGVACAAALLGMPATIVMPADAPRVKTDATRGYGAKIVPYDRRRESREQIAARIAEESGAVIVPSFDDPEIIAGQGTIGLEMVEQARAAGSELDFVLAPCSGGGLSSGVALGVSGRSPDTRIVTVEPEGYDGARLSLEGAERIAAEGTRSTVADALTSPAPGVLPFAILQSLNARGVAVSDDELMRAVAYAALQLKLVVEPGGAAALAALLARRFSAPGKTIAVVLSGGNIDVDMLQRCIQ